MDIQIELVAVDRTVAALRGELDRRSIAAARPKLMALAGGTGDLVLDITEVTDRTGGGAERLARIVSDISGLGGHLQVRGLRT